ncbi:unnamed protein product [Victoria cruziana]
MRILHKSIVPNGSGSIKIVPEETDDLWHAYNIISVGDIVLADTFRKVQREAASGGRDSERVRLKLEIQVEDIDYDNAASVLRLHGKNIMENEHVKIGAFHTIEVEQHRSLVLKKAVMGTFFFFDSITTTRSRIEASIPRKHGPALGGYEKALNRFFENVLQDQFYSFLLLEAERRELRSLIENKSRILLVHSSSGYKHSLREVLDAPNVISLIKDTKAAQEVRALKDFFEMLSICIVFVINFYTCLLRSCDIKTRRKYVNLMDSIKDSGGTAHVFSSMHVSGEQLAQLTGIAAILRFPLPDLEDIDM